MTINDNDAYEIAPKNRFVVQDWGAKFGEQRMPQCFANLSLQLNSSRCL